MYDMMYFYCIAVNLKSRSSNLSMTSQTGQQIQESEQQSRSMWYICCILYSLSVSLSLSLPLVYRSSQGIVRDLRTGKGLSL